MPGPHRHQLRALADRAALRATLLMAAMVAHQSVAEAVLDQPGRAIRALETMAAGPAQGKRRVAAAIEEEQRLLAALDRVADGLLQRWRDEAAARRRIAAQVQRGDRGQRPCRVAAGEQQVRVAALARVHLRLERGGCGGEHDSRLLDPAAHHRHVAGVVGDAILLLVGGLVLLIDDDDREVFERQEQRRAGADHHLRLARRHGVPDERAAPRRDRRVPFGRERAEPRGETGEKLRGECDLGQQDKGLPSLTKRRRHGLHVDLGLARAGDAFEQRHAEPARGDGFDEAGGRPRLWFGEMGRRMIGVERGDRRLGRDGRQLQRAGGEQRVDDARRAACGLRQRTLAKQRFGACRCEDLLPRRCHLLGNVVGGEQAEARRGRGAGERRAQAHTQHHAARAQRPAGDPVDEIAEAFRQARDVDPRRDSLQAWPQLCA